MQVRFDDTNPTKERDEFVDSIVADIARLGLRYEKITYTSDYFPQLMECAERLIRWGCAARCACTMSAQQAGSRHGRDARNACAVVGTDLQW